ncbi:MAG: Coenzyme F420 hydrogenase/dehydrogenase, beta subunit C-terminal domain, partial [Alistipes sp.]
MIQFKQKQDCCGCWACVQRCPKQCITMQEDEEGFLYPHVDLNDCTRCGLCERVCPVLNTGEPRESLAVYAAKNRNEEVRMQSSSGGIFTPLAEAILNQKGVVFGAKFDTDWKVIHGYTETKEGLAAFRGSKYVQSQMGICYQLAEEFLKAGRQVLFSGTPCQIAGLHRYLMRDYDNLLTVDVVCHGVPSPMIWREYLKFILRPQGDGKNSVLSLSEPPVLTGISFRDKSTGWKKFGFLARKSASKADQNTVFLHETLDKNLYMEGFLKNLYLRPSCYACAARKGKSGSDITIADYWGIPADMDDDK